MALPSVLIGRVARGVGQQIIDENTADVEAAHLLSSPPVLIWLKDESVCHTSARQSVHRSSDSRTVANLKSAMQRQTE